MSSILLCSDWKKYISLTVEAEDIKLQLYHKEIFITTVTWKMKHKWASRSLMT